MGKWNFSSSLEKKKRRISISPDVFKTIFLSAKEKEETKEGHYQIDYNKADDSLIFSIKGTEDSKAYQLCSDGSVNSWSSVTNEQVLELEKGSIDEVFINFIKS